jgi:non-homologous end joining protein Ku
MLFDIREPSTGFVSILRYAQELRDEALYFDRVTGEAEPEAVALAVELINKQSGKFERMVAEDLVGTIFPDQTACAENLVGELVEEQDRI